MNKISFEEQLMQGAYVLGGQRDRLALKKKKLVQQLRYEKHSARLSGISKRYEFGTIIFGIIGLIILINFDWKNVAGNWALSVIAVSLILFAGGIAICRRKLANRSKRFHARFMSNVFEYTDL